MNDGDLLSKQINDMRERKKRDKQRIIERAKIDIEFLKENGEFKEAKKLEEAIKKFGQ